MENIKLVYGCMKAGKSAYLIDLYNDKIKEGKTVEVFEPEENTRDGAQLKSRKYKQVIDATIYKNELKSNADVVILDELNLVNIDKIEQLKKDCLELQKQGKQIYIACLNKMADGRNFPQYDAIKNIAKERIKIKGKCEFCDEPATMTKLIRDKRATDYIEGIYNRYYACCEECWEPIQTIEILK